MLVREPIVAGRFYPDEPEACRQALQECLPREEATVEGTLIGGIVPHAGWVYSGAVAGQVMAALARRRPRTAVVFGAVHVRHGARASVFSSGAWETPLGTIRVDERLAERICGASSLLESNPHAHEFEHSIEVEVPFLQHLLPEIRIVPVMVPPNEHAHVLGEVVGRTCRDSEADVAFIGSTDLTHYGPGYQFTPRGVGAEALGWAKNENDRRMIDLMLRLDAESVVSEARAHQNACGAGAIAATIAACKQLGAARAEVLRHTTSYEVGRAWSDEPASDAVGYAGVVFLD
jgi:AmmeMemoRadiSam system protein B